MRKEIKEFYEYLAGNADLMENLQENLKRIHTKEELNEYIESKIMPLAKEKRFNFSQEDLMKYEKKSLKKLTEEDLLNVAGGFSPKSAILTGGIFSLILLGAGASGNSTAHAAVSKDIILNSTEQLQSQNTDDKNVSKLEAGINKILETSAETETESNIETTESSAFESYLNQESAESSVSELSSNQKILEDTASESGLTEQSSDEQLSKKDVIKSTNELIENSKTEETTNTDMEYIADALNLLDPYIYALSGTTENFRLFDGNKEKICTGELGGDDIPLWDYKRDEGKGSPNLMSCLFPSSSGMINSEGGAHDIPSFSKDYNPTPEDIAKIAGYLHNYIRCEDPIKAQQAKDDLEKLINTNWKKYKIDNDISQSLISYLGINDTDSLAALRNKITKLKPTQKSHLSKLLIKKFAANSVYDENLINDIDTFIGEYVNSIDNIIKITDKLNKYDLKIDLKNKNFSKPLKTYLHLLQNAEYMINEQEIINEENTDGRVLPKYTTERMLMCYFIHHFNTQNDVKRFYDEAKKIIKTSSNRVSNDKLNEKIDRLDNIKKVFQKISEPDNCPYKGTLVSNACAKAIEITEDNKIKFSKTLFADCADTAVRHIINLLGYNDLEQWKFFLGNPNQREIKTLEQEVKKVCDAINENGELENKSLKERIKLFFYYQSKEGADIATLEARSFWNYVISNMDKDSTEYTYKIRYRRMNNELSSGWINSLKLTYNIVNALKGDDDSFKERLDNAKQKIDLLETEFENNKNSDKLKDYLEDAIESTFSIITKIKTDSCCIFQGDSNDLDVYSSVQITKDSDSTDSDYDFVFEDIQRKGHAQIDFDPITIFDFEYNESELKSFMENDEVAQLLSKTFNIKTKYVSIFNTIYGNLKILDDYDEELYNKSPAFYHNVNTLKFLKQAQGEGNNYSRLKSLLKSDYKLSDIKIIDKAGKSKDAPIFILDNYLNVYTLICKFLDVEIDEDLHVRSGSELYDAVKKAFPSRIITTDDGSEILCRIKSDNTASIYLFKTKENVETFKIPSKINIGNDTYNVPEIMGYPYSLKIKTIIVPEDMTDLTIATGAFFRMDNMESIDFTHAQNLTSLTIKEEAFRESGISKINIPDTVTSLEIDNSAFAESGLKTFTVPESVTSLKIGEEAFGLCENLKEFNIPDTVTSLVISGGAFQNSGLETFTCPKSVTSLNIAPSAFYFCGNLKKFNIPDTVTSLVIDGEAFIGCSSLKEINIPDTVTSLVIDGGAFQASGLETFTYPKSVTSLKIENYTFNGCRSLKEINIPDTVTSLEIGENAFTGTNLETFTVPKSITSLNIKPGAFRSCKNLKEINIPDTVTSLEIGENAFTGTKLETFTVPKSITSLNIKPGAFRSCKNLKEINIPDTVTSLEIGERAFQNSGLETFTVPESVTSLKINPDAFRSCKNLKEFNIPNTVTFLEIGERAFEESRLKTFTVPESVTSLKIDKLAFNYCYELEKFNISERRVYKNVDSRAFENCNNLKNRPRNNPWNNPWNNW